MNPRTKIRRAMQDLEISHEKFATTGGRLIIFEEPSHLVDVGSRVPPSAAGDWFKTLSDVNGISLVTFPVYSALNRTTGKELR